MGERGPGAGKSEYAQSLNINIWKLQRMGGMERVKAMSEDARVLMSRQANKPSAPNQVPVFAGCKRATPCRWHMLRGELCGTCRESKRTYMRERIQAFRERNPGYMARRMRKQREAARKNGMCIVCCARPAVEGKSSCVACLERQRDGMRRAA